MKTHTMMAGLMSMVAGARAMVGTITKTNSKDRIKGKNKKVKHFSHTKQVQFPINELLDCGRHRYFVKHGMIVDRKVS